MQKNFFYYLLPSIIIGLSAIVMTPIVTFYLNPKDFGIIAILSAVTMPIAPLSSTGATWVLAGNYYRTSDEKERKELLFNILLLDFLLKLFWVSVFWLSAPLWLPIIIKEFEVEYIFYFRLLLLSTLLTTLWPSISYFIVLQQKGHIHALFEVFQWAVGSVAIIICLVFLRLTTITLFIGPVASGLFSLIAGLWYMRSYINFRVSKKWIFEIFKVGMPSIPANLVEITTNISDRYFIQRWINLSQLGIYSHSVGYRDIFAMGAKAFSRTVAPPMLEMFSNNSNIKEIKQKFKQWYGLLGIAGVFITLFSYEIINVLTHGKFVMAAPLVPIWFLLALSFSYGLPYSQYLFAHKKNVFLMYSAIITGGFFIGITALFIYKLDIFGAVIAMVLSNFTLQISRRIYAVKLGCDRIGEEEFLYISALIISLYSLNIFFEFGIYKKIAGFMLLSFVILYRYGLLDIVKANGRRVSAFFSVKNLTASH